MINRDQTILPLQRRTLLAVTGISAAAWITCPAVALVIFLAACVAYALIQTLYIVILIIACVTIVVGGLAALVGILAINDAPGVFVGGIFAAVIGFGLFHVAPSLNVGEEAFTAIVLPAQLTIEWFIVHDWCVWAWIPTAVAFLVAVSLWGSIVLTRHLPELHRHMRRRFLDCPTCHHRGRPTHACSKCGAVEHDLRASAYGVLFARCDSCGTWLPTLDLLGRGSLTRSCSGCGSALSHGDMGRLPVWHVAVAYMDRDISPRTTLCAVSGRLAYVHESGAGHVAGTRGAASLGYLSLLDQLVICGDERSLRVARPMLPGILSVMERGVGADVRRRTRLAAYVVEPSTKTTPLLPSERGDAMASWTLAMSAMFSNVSTWRADMDSRWLGTLVSR